MQRYIHSLRLFCCITSHIENEIQRMILNFKSHNTFATEDGKNFNRHSQPYLPMYFGDLTNNMDPVQI